MKWFAILFSSTKTNCRKEKQKKKEKGHTWPFDPTHRPPAQPTTPHLVVLPSGGKLLGGEHATAATPPACLEASQASLSRLEAPWSPPRSFPLLPTALVISYAR